VSQLPLYTAVAHRGNGRTGHMYTPCLAPTARGDALPRGGSGEGGGSENAASFAPLSAPAEATMVSAELDLKLSRRGARSSATAVLCWHQRLVVSSVLGQRQLDAESRCRVTATRSRRAPRVRWCCWREGGLEFGGWCVLCGRASRTSPQPHARPASAP